MLVLIRWQGRKMAVPLSQLAAIDPDESTTEAIGDWHYWVAQGCVSDLRTPAESSQCTVTDRYSAMSLAPLRPDVASDYTDFAAAREVMEENYWLNGLGIQ